MWWTAERAFKSLVRWKAEIARQQASLPPHLQCPLVTMEKQQTHARLAGKGELFESRFKPRDGTDLLTELANTGMDCPRRGELPVPGRRLGKRGAAMGAPGADSWEKHLNSGAFLVADKFPWAGPSLSCSDTSIWLKKQPVLLIFTGCTGRTLQARAWSLSRISLGGCGHRQRRPLYVLPREAGVPTFPPQARSQE